MRNRKRKKKPGDGYVFLQSSAMAARSAEKEIEKYLENSGKPWSVARYPSGIKCYRIAMPDLVDFVKSINPLAGESPQAAAETLMRAFERVHVAEAPGISPQVFYAYREPTGLSTWIINKSANSSQVIKKRRRRI